MKKILFALVAIATLSFAGCSKDDDNSVDTNALVGRWRITAVMSEGEYVDVTTDAGELVFEPTYITFNSDGSYSSTGFFADGSGTYELDGKTIITYVGGDEYYRYDIISLTATQGEVKMYEKSDPTDFIQMKVTKQ